jgi:hypothetical protein
MGDSAYKGTYPFLATPFLDANAVGNPRKQHFNVKFRRAHVSVECGIGKLKAKFQILKTGIRLKNCLDRNWVSLL